jgi:hypothetical protein
MTDRELMQQALDALEFQNNLHPQNDSTTEWNHSFKWNVQVAEALRARLVQLEPEPVAWKVWTVHNHIFFSIGVQTFQINDVLEHEPEVSAKEFSEWLATQLRHALTQLSNTAPPQPELEELGEIVPADEEQLKRIAKLVEPEPVAWAMNRPDGLFLDIITPEEHESFEGEYTVPLYTAPPQREWQGLTDEEIMDACSAVWASHPVEVGQVVQNLLKERNT